MMDYGVFHFACPKFCGANWFGEMMEKVGFESAPLSRLEGTFHDSRNHLKVSLVRHPMTWLSLCFDAVRFKFLDDYQPFSSLPTHTFDAFVRAYVHECPEAFGNVFKKYQADSMIRIEDLPWALVELLMATGMEQRVALNVTRLPQIVSKEAQVERKLYNKVMEINRDFFERYDYV